ncbi:MAG: hypothetical protein V3U34_00440 [candidate division NC10 bacterium]
MPHPTIEFGNRQESGWERLGGSSPVSMNVVVDGNGTVHRRPAIQAYPEAPSTAVDANGIEGLHASVQGPIYAVGVPASQTGLGSRDIYSIGGGGSTNITAANGGGTGGADLRGFTRPVFAETETLVVIAGGREMEKVVVATSVPSRLRGLVDGQDPPKATFVAANAQRLIANDPLADVNVARVSGAGNAGDPSGWENWSVVPFSGAGQFFASARPDPVLAIHENTNEVFIHGSSNVQLYRADPRIFYAAVSTREYGVAAPYAVAKIDQEFIWLDHRRRIMRSDGRTVEEISQPIDQDLQDMEKVDDAFGYRINIGYIDGYAITFPSEGKTLFFQRGGGWSQWQGFDEDDNAWLPFPVLSQAHRVFGGNDTTIVGLSDGRVAQLLNNVNDDLGVRVKAFTETGYYDRGTDNRKWCKSVKLAFRRGLTSTTEPLGFLSWSDQPGVWSSPIPLHLGQSGATRPVIPLRSLGTYRRRAWRFTFSETQSELSLVRVTEEYDILDS